MGKYLFYIQLPLILLLIYVCDLEKLLSNVVLASLFTLGITLAFWAFYNMGSKNYSPFPEPKPNGEFTQKGAYKYIRHPMYTGLILIAAALTLSNLDLIPFLVFAVLVYVLDEKSTLEEILLAKMHPEYKNYQAKTKKFIPFTY